MPCTQDDFSLLTVSDCQVFGADNGFCGCASESEPVGKLENVLKPEIYELIAAWESSVKSVKDAKPVAPSLDTSLCSEMDSLPLSFTSSYAVPKRFYRRFWLSLTRRMLDERAARNFKDAQQLPAC
jgi:hypothetical protein